VNDGKDGKSPTVTLVENQDGSKTVTVNNNDGSAPVSTNITNGKDGKSPTATVEKVGDTATITITNADGTQSTATVKDGKNGEKGDQGDKGADGKSATATVTDNGNGTHTITVNNPDGTSTSTTVNDGKDGKSPTVTLVENQDGSKTVTVNNNDGSEPVSTNITNGKDGATGPAGPQGPKGEDGAPGGAGDVKPGKNITVDTKNNPDGSKTFTVHGKDTTVSSGSDKVVVTPTPNAETGVTDYKVDLSQDTKDKIDGGFGLKDQNGKEIKQDLNTAIAVVGKGPSLSTSVITDTDGAKKLQVALTNNVQVGEKGEPGQNGQPGKDGIDGTVGVNGKDGSSVVLNGKDGSIGLTGPKGADGKDGASANISVKDGRAGLDGAKGQDGKDGTEGKTRIVYETKDPKDPTKTITEEVATLNDGLRFAGDDKDVEVSPLNSRLDIKGGANKDKLTDNNIGVVANPDKGTLNVKLAQNIDLSDKGSVKTGNTKIDNDGLTVEGGPTVTKDKVDVAGNKVTNVKDGDVNANSKDAVNGSQLYEVKETAEAGWNLTVNGKDSSNVKPRATVDLNNKDGNIEITKNGNDVTFGLAKDVKLPENGSLNVGGVTINNQGINAGNKVISNVAPGVRGTDAVNVNQLNAVDKKVGKLDKRVRGIGASSAAAASLPQVYIPGKSMVAAAAGGYAGASAISVGYSRASDNGKLILKLQGTANSQGHVSGGVGVGYQW
ncbi:YadA family autotransporter adhesin, partial [Ursidibacter arcticus]